MIKACADYFSIEFSNSAQAGMMCRVLCFVLNIKGKNLATFYCGCLCRVYESLVKSRDVCLHTYLGLSKIKIHVESLMIVSVATQRAQRETQVGVLVVAVNPRKK